jgi:N-glycosylase/DNA lyase
VKYHKSRKLLSLVLGHCKDLWGKFKRATDTGLKDGIQKTFEAITRFVTIQAICRRVRYRLENLRDILEDLEDLEEDMEKRVLHDLEDLQEDLTVCLFNDGDMEKRVLCDSEEDLRYLIQRQPLFHQLTISTG